MIKDLKHAHTLQMKDANHMHVNEINELKIENIELRSKLELSLKDNEILQLRLLLAQKA